MTKIITTKAYDAYWQFAFNRQNVFFNKLNGMAAPWTDDPIIQKYKFTNAYRVTDRVSQYLVKNIIYSTNHFTEEDMLFRIILFKLFNKIETWEYLENKLGEIKYSSFDEELYASLLSQRLDQSKKIYSSAYIMPSGCSCFGYHQKHKNNLALISYMFKDNFAVKVAKTKSLKELYELILSYPTLGSFLAFQYSIDINYSEICNYDEMSFVVAGPGAKRGIDKCFVNREYDYPYYIQYVADYQEYEFSKRGYLFKNLFGRPLQLIDCQNLFCETDKYTRVLFPDLKIKDQKVRIKQIYKYNPNKIDLFLPPKWDLTIKG